LSTMQSDYVSHRNPNQDELFLGGGAIVYAL
jgi:hypothetical protein